MGWAHHGAATRTWNESRYQARSAALSETPDPAEQQEQDDDDADQSNPAEAVTTVISSCVPVITASAEQNDQQQNNNYQTHGVYLTSCRIAFGHIFTSRATKFPLLIIPKKYRPAFVYRRAEFVREETTAL
jgi:hypothetical protein